MEVVLIRVTTAVNKHHDPKQVVEEKDLLGLHLHITVHHQRKLGQELKQGRNLEAEADADTCP